jgi:D-mannonate dehydratase
MTLEDILALKMEIEEAGLELEVIESVSVFYEFFVKIAPGIPSGVQETSYLIRVSPY